MHKAVKGLFQEVFGGDPEGVWFAPGRVNLIGEHTDYNGGHVFPCALTLGTFAAGKRREDGQFRFFSKNMEETGVVEVQGTMVPMDPERGWANYPMGVVQEMAKAGHPVQGGLDVAFYGNLPQGAGLSSSASMEVLTALLLSELFGSPMDRVDMALLCQRVENGYIGVQSGIMDQFAIALGQEGHAMLLNTETLYHRQVPLDLRHYALIIANTNKQRGLKDSKYNERRRECEAALQILQEVHPVKALGELDLETLEGLRGRFQDETLYRRARHAVTENARTLEAERALSKGDLEGFGQLMMASHDSLRRDYAVTGLELDTLQEAASAQPGVLGSRMTGAGFGGCTVTLLEKDRIHGFMEAVGSAYAARIGYAPSFYVASVGSGARRISLRA